MKLVSGWEFPYNSTFIVLKELLYLIIGIGYKLE